MDIDQTALLTIVRKFIETRKGLEPSALDRDSQLFQEGYLDSFSLVELIAELGQILPGKVAPGDLIADDFASVSTLEQRLREL